MAETIRVLHVDDDPDYAELAATFLERKDDRLTVTSETSTEAGLSRLSENGVDCVISDYDMADMDGLAFLETVREEYPDLPFILFTGKGSEEIASEAISAGVTDYLQKETGAEHYAVLANRVRDAVERVQSEVSYQEIFDKAGIGLTVRDIETNEILDVNQRYCEMLGYDYDEALSLTLEELTADVPGYSPADARAKLERAVEEGSASFEWPDETKDGEVIWVNLHLTRAEIDGRQRLLVSVQDITERKQREQELTMAKRRFDSVFNNPVAFMALLQPDGTVLDANSTALDFIDRELREVVGDPFWETPWWAHSDPLQVDLRSWVDRAADGERVRFQAEHQGPQGDQVIIDGGLHPVTDDEGAVTSILAAGRDISDRLTKQRDLERYREAIDAVAAGVFMVDDEGRFEMVNRRMAELSGFDRETLETASLSRLMDESARADCSDIVADPDMDQKRTFEWSLQTASGDSVPCEARIAGVELDADRECTIWACADMSQRIEREEELKRQNDRLERVVSVISHDLRNPLTVAQGRVELAQMQSDDDEHLPVVASSLDRMSEMIDDILALARTGQRVDATDRVELHSVIEGCWGNVDTGDADLAVADDIAVRADAAHIQNLLENLIRNAVEHGGEDVTVTVGRLNGGDGFFIEDDGPGIPPADREKVFESGFSSKADNVGFGLNIVQEIAEAHGWTVRLAKGDDGGARFEFAGVELLD